MISQKWVWNVSWKKQLIYIHQKGILYSMVYTSVYTKKSLYIHQKKQLFSMRWGVAIAMIPLRSQEVLSSEWHSNCQEPDARWLSLPGLWEPGCWQESAHFFWWITYWLTQQFNGIQWGTVDSLAQLKPRPWWGLPVLCQHGQFRSRFAEGQAEGQHLESSFKNGTPENVRFVWK